MDCFHFRVHDVSMRPELVRRVNMEDRVFIHRVSDVQR